MSRIELEGFVTSATGPDAGWTTGRQIVELAVRMPNGVVVLATDEPKVPVAQWIVRGMTVPVAIDPDRPERCEVVVERVPALADRMLANDWALCNLEAVAARARLLRHEAQTRSLMAQRPEMAHLYAATMEQEQTQVLEQVQAKLAGRPQEIRADPDGRLRGTADLIAYERKPASREQHNDNMGWKGRRLYRVWLFGYGPYAVMDEVRFKPRDVKCLLGGGDVPVSVGAADRTDVRFEWDEYHYDPQVEQQKRIQRELQHDMGHAQNLMGNHLQMMFAAVPPDQRQMLAETLRASGVQVPDELL